MTTTRAATPRYRALVLAMLLLVYTFNFLDRQILGILAQPIKADLGLTDTQLGALGGIAFALLYSTLGVPLAVVADRTSRTWVVTASLAVWSAFTALCGAATGFWQLFAFRLGVGVGEAGGVAPSYAIISDYYPPASRARALSVYAMGIPLGLAAGALLGGYIAQAVNWRMAFVVVGVAGLVLAPVFRLVVREPVRGGSDPAGAAPGPAAAKHVPVREVFGILARKPSFWLMAFAASSSSLIGYGLAFWIPSVLIRSHGFDLIGASQYLGSLLLVGGVSGVLLGGVLADRFGRADRGAYALLPTVAWIVTVPFFAGALWVGSPGLAWALFLVPNALNILWLGPVTTAVQHLVPPQMRATASASFLFINNLVGLGGGSLVLGVLSDRLTPVYGAEALRWAAIYGLGFYLIAALLMAFAVRPLRRDWVG